ncbi:hypothetical protein D9M68_981760 [compost metagenome]
MVLLDARAHLSAGTKGQLAPMAGDRAQGHLLDEADVQAAGDGELDQLEHLVVVAALLDHAVELDPTKARGPCGRDAGQYLVEPIAPGEGGETLAPE